MDQPRASYWITAGSLISAGTVLVVVGAATRLDWLTYLGLVAIGAALTWLLVMDPRVISRWGSR